MKVLTQLGSAGARLAMTAVATTTLAATALVTAGALAGPASAAATPNWLRAGPPARSSCRPTTPRATPSSPTTGNTPGQVAFSPDGSQLIVTTKANGDDIDVFGVRFDGTLSG